MHVGAATRALSLTLAAGILVLPARAQTGGALRFTDVTDAAGVALPSA